MVSPITTQITLPADIADRLTRSAAATGMSLPAYLVYLEQCRAGRLDQSTQDALRFMLTKHSASLEKLAQ